MPMAADSAEISGALVGLLVGVKGNLGFASAFENIIIPDKIQISVKHFFIIDSLSLWNEKFNSNFRFSY
jgi:hypothetical protein